MRVLLRQCSRGESGLNPVAPWSLSLELGSLARNEQASTEVAEHPGAEQPSTEAAEQPCARTERPGTEQLYESSLELRRLRSLATALISLALSSVARTEQHGTEAPGQYGNQQPGAKQSSAEQPC